MRIKSLKVQLAFFLFLFAGYLAITDKDSFFLLSIIVAITATVFTDSLFHYLKNKKITVTESSIVSGLIIGFVLSPDTGLWLPGYGNTMERNLSMVFPRSGRNLFFLQNAEIGNNRRLLYCLFTGLLRQLLFSFYISSVLNMMPIWRH